LRVRSAFAILGCGMPFADEIAAQPDCWRGAAALATRLSRVLPPRGARVAVVGCGTLLLVGQAIAALREAAGLGETDAFPASEFPAGRRYDLVVALSRSGTTSEVIAAVDALPRAVTTLAVTASGGTPLAARCDRTIVLDFADERSVMQTAFATTTLALVRAHLGHAIEPVAADGERALDAVLPGADDGLGAVAFLGTGWRVGLAREAALKVREAAALPSEAHPALEYRHGPISAAGPGTLVWAIGPIAGDLEADVLRTGAAVERSAHDPMAELVRVQRFAAAAARARGRDPDHPPHVSRSVLLS
jgi:fructoselysine-6-P-deglycase FrlB-like protein